LALSGAREFDLSEQNYDSAEMPRGGFRLGAGGPKGPRGPQKKTIERALIAEQVVRRAEMSGEKLAKEILNDFMQLFAGMAASVQPLPPGTKRPPGRGKPSVRAFEKWARLAVETATQLAKYQSPTFRAIAVSTPGGPVQSGNDAKLIEGKVVVLDSDPIGASRVYRQIVAAAGRRS
jgi:hypothetical protein